MYLNGLHSAVTEEELRELAEPYGEVVECNVKRDNGLRGRSFAFITFSGPECVQKMLEDHACQPLTLDDKQIELRVALPRVPGSKGRQIVRQKNKLFVGGLSADTKEEDLRSHFMQFGQVQEAELKYDKITSRHRGFGFVTFESCECAQEARRNHYQEIKGKKVEIKEALPPELLGTSRSRKGPPSPGYHGYPSVMPSYAVCPWSPGYMAPTYYPPVMAGGQNGRPLLYNGYHYMGGYSSYRGDYSGKDMMSPTAVDYIADQFQGMGFGPGHMYPLVPMTMDHAHMSGYSIPHSAPAQYSMAMTPAYTSGHIPSSPPSSGGPSSGAMARQPTGGSSAQSTQTAVLVN